MRLISVAMPPLRPASSPHPPRVGFGADLDDLDKIAQGVPGKRLPGILYEAGVINDDQLKEATDNNRLAQETREDERERREKEKEETKWK
ncbi:MAG: hypothetical protein QE263_08245 [Vampirovibrionales bacterium]|nr:hypothetical protein [Vampirovibrionales bacterium]